MTSRDFCFWLQGAFEMNAGQMLNQGQYELMRRHLALVFKHEIDPSMGDAANQAALNQIHDNPQIGGTGPGGVLYRC